jgi:hypothetical protein
MSVSNPSINGTEEASNFNRGKTQLLVAAIVLALVAAVILVWAEGRQSFQIAQASIVIILLLFSSAAWVWWEKRNERPHFSPTAHIYHRAIHKVLLCVAIGVNALVLNGIRIERWRNDLVAQSVGYGILFGGSAFICGVMLGYLFGLRPSGQTKGADGQASTALPQSNLEEIADWLTKLILGAGLVALTKLPAPILRFVTFMAIGVDPTPAAKVTPVGAGGNPAIALAIMGFFSTCGLLYGYLWTRYEQAVTLDTDTDSSALALVDRWLRAATTPDDQMRKATVDAIKKASLEARMRIFQQSQQYRVPSTPEVNDRSVVVFQALVDADSRQFFHRNRGECALAFMGKTKDPKNADDDWNHAHDLLDDAITTRDRSGEKGWQAYELARAVCQIHLDADFKKGQSSSPGVKQLITADLDKAKDVTPAESGPIDVAHVIADWKCQNQLT